MVRWWLEVLEEVSKAKELLIAEIEASIENLSQKHLATYGNSRAFGAEISKYAIQQKYNERQIKLDEFKILKRRIDSVSKKSMILVKTLSVIEESLTSSGKFADAEKALNMYNKHSFSQ